VPSQAAGFIDIAADLQTGCAIRKEVAMNDFFLQVRSQEKLRELRKEGMAGQEFRRLRGRVGLVHSPSARFVAIMVLFLGLMLILVR
jgi:hypothetical protein